MSRCPSFLRIVLWVLFAGVMFVLVAVLVQQAFQKVGSDAAIFVAVGRGISNGLVPYKDLFETKPPGMFLVAAASFSLTGGFALMYFSFLSAIVAHWAVACAVVFKRASSRILLPLGLTSVTLVCIYGALRGGVFGTDVFAALFCLPCTILFSKERWKVLHYLIVTLCITLIAFFREPYIVTLLAVALLTVRKPAHLVTRYVLCGALSFPVFLLLLFLCGVLRDYLVIYAPVLLFSKGGTLSPLITGYFVLRDIGEMARFSLFFPVIFVALFVTLWVDQPRRRMLLACSVPVLAVAMTFGGGVYDANAVPLYIALILESIRSLETHGRKILLMAVSAVVLLSGAQVAVSTMSSHPFSLPVDEQWEREKQFAFDIDSILDDCKIARYGFVGLSGVYVYAHTTHSPEGPIFIFDKHFIDNDALVEPYMKNLSLEHIVLLRQHSHLASKDRAFYERAKAQLADMTDVQPFPCTTKTAKMDGYTLLYRP